MTRPKILIVDDEPRNLLAMSAILGDLDVEIVEATSGEQALSQALAHELALVLLDVRMPEMDGFETAGLLRGNPSTEAVPIIFVTATSRELRLEFKGYDAGAVDFIFKPVNETILRSKVTVFLEMDRRRRALEIAHRKMRESDLFLRSILASMSDGVVVTDGEGRTLYSNSACDRLLGVPVASTDSLEWGLLGPEMRPIAPGELPLARAMRGEAVERRDLRVERADAPEGVWLGAKANPIWGERGEPLGAVCVLREITESKRSEEILEQRVRERTEELRESEAQLRQSQKLEALGTLAGGVAHDFNNLLAVVLGFAQFLREGLAEDDTRLADVKEIERAAERGAALTRRLLLFSRKEAGRPSVVALNEVVGGIEGLLRRTLGADIELHCELTPDLPSIKADPMHIEQVLVNLGVNARDAMSGGGRLGIRTYGQEISEGDGRLARHGFESKAGQYVCLEIEDTGRGMSPSLIDRIFEPFFTTKEREKGTGLGLSIVYGIVRQCGGGIEVDSVEGRGTVFRIYLPVTGESTEAPAAPADVELVHGKGETVLIVEDEEGLRELTARLLTQHGYEVLQAPDGAVAERVFVEQGSKIDLLLTDVVMPELSGPALVARLQRKRPDLPVVYMSGYSDEVGRRHGLEPERVAIVHKPFKQETLLRALRFGLDQGAVER
ncbi:MAG: hypothetical protein CME06_10245 [Gemmatimonadetes bacterium]|nr:hypothetical protein [Gemmatimonadota bacterium]